jgi:5-methylcytosine-specific restriction enzyme A
MTPDSIQEAFSQLEYRQDIRHPPDPRRRGQFHAGWADATKSGKSYSTRTLKKLTWHNLGYRFGKHFEEQSPKRINEAFDVLVRLYKRPLTNDTVTEPAPSAEQYEAAIRELGGISETQRLMLRLHYHAPARVITASQLARAVGYDHYAVANSQYGWLGRMIGNQLGYNPTEDRVGTLVTFDYRQGEWHWLLRPEVAEALESLGWVEEPNWLLPEEAEFAAKVGLPEGRVIRVTVNAYERNPEARRLCIEYHGRHCCICRFSFEAVYGEPAEGFIHVHHLRPLSEIGHAYVVDPFEDLRPVCPNCHAVLHLRTPAYSIEEVQALLR